MRSESSGEMQINDYAQAASAIAACSGHGLNSLIERMMGGLLLRFDDATELHVMNSNAQFESFSGSLGGTNLCGVATV